MENSNLISIDLVAYFGGLQDYLMQHYAFWNRLPCMVFSVPNRNIDKS